MSSWKHSLAITLKSDPRGDPVKKFLKGLKWFVLHVEEIISITALVVMICAVFLNVLLRYLFRNPTSWSDELAMICMAYVTFVGGAVGYKHNLHFGIDVILDKLPHDVQMFIRRLSNFAFIPLFAFLTYIGMDLTIHASKRMIYSNWSYKIIDASLPIGFASMTCYAIYFFIMSFTDKERYEKRFSQIEDEQEPELTEGGDK